MIASTAFAVEPHLKISNLESCHSVEAGLGFVMQRIVKTPVANWPYGFAREFFKRTLVYKFSDNKETEIESITVQENDNGLNDNGLSEFISANDGDLKKIKYYKYRFYDDGCRPSHGGTGSGGSGSSCGDPKHYSLIIYDGSIFSYETIKIDNKIRGLSPKTVKRRKVSTDTSVFENGGEIDKYWFDHRGVNVYKDLNCSVRREL